MGFRPREGLCNQMHACGSSKFLGWNPSPRSSKLLSWDPNPPGKGVRSGAFGRGFGGEGGASCKKAPSVNWETGPRQTLNLPLILALRLPDREKGFLLFRNSSQPLVLCQHLEWMETGSLSLAAGMSPQELPSLTTLTSQAEGGQEAREMLPERQGCPLSTPPARTYSVACLASGQVGDGALG